METEIITSPWFAVRFDGRSFGDLTKRLRRQGPYNERFGLLMIEAAIFVKKELNADFAFVGSDEITLGWFPPKTAESQRIFGGKKDKIISVGAAALSAFFAVEFNRAFLSEYIMYPHFDGRVSVTANTEEEFREKIKERVISVTRNSISMLAQFHFSHKELQGKKCNEMRPMLEAKGDPWGKHPHWFKFGFYIFDKGAPVIVEGNYPPTPSATIIDVVPLNSIMEYGKNHGMMDDFLPKLIIPLICKSSSEIISSK